MSGTDVFVDRRWRIADVRMSRYPERFRPSVVRHPVLWWRHVTGRCEYYKYSEFRLDEGVFDVKSEFNIRTDVVTVLEERQI